MGRHVIHIESVGPHHNGKDYDGDAIARDVVEVLKAKGHNVESAHFFTDDGRADIIVGPRVETPADSKQTQGEG